MNKIAKVIRIESRPDPTSCRQNILIEFAVDDLYMFKNKELISNFFDYIEKFGLIEELIVRMVMLYKMEEGK